MKQHSQPILAYLLVTLFIGLKLTGHIDWHWAWVLSPLWIYAAAVFFAAFTIAFVKSFRAAVKRKAN